MKSVCRQDGEELCPGCASRAADGPAAAERLGCSRLAGEPVCRCGGSPMGRYCLWSYYREAMGELTGVLPERSGFRPSRPE